MYNTDDAAAAAACFLFLINTFKFRYIKMFFSILNICYYYLKEKKIVITYI